MGAEGSPNLDPERQQGEAAPAQLRGELGHMMRHARPSRRAAVAGIERAW
jgi:hypothetical protein